uniref:Uncharacterized protein n=1 Tax=Myotis myotis TaxID=51298 RepID=A0A7J7UPN6_MYOMY|nr:hypothetical protein mMyoMyo1_008630 [Myotis myotis]
MVGPVELCKLADCTAATPASVPQTPHLLAHPSVLAGDSLCSRRHLAPSPWLFAQTAPPPTGLPCLPHHMHRFRFLQHLSQPEIILRWLVRWFSFALPTTKSGRRQAAQASRRHMVSRVTIAVPPVFNEGVNQANAQV